MAAKLRELPDETVLPLLSQIAHELCELAQYDFASEIYVQLQEVQGHVLKRLRQAEGTAATGVDQLRSLANVFDTYLQADMQRLPDRLRPVVDEIASPKNPVEEMNHLGSLLSLHDELRDQAAFRRDVGASVQNPRR